MPEAHLPPGSVDQNQSEGVNGVKKRSTSKRRVATSLFTARTVTQITRTNYGFQYHVVSFQM